MRNRLLVSILGRIAGALCQIALLAQVAKVLSPVEFGIFSVSVSACWVLNTPLDFGMGTAVLRGMNEHLARRSLTTFASIRVFVTLSVILVLLVLSHGGALDFVSVFAVVYTLGESAGDLAVGIFQGLKESNKATILLITRRLSALLPFVFLANDAPYFWSTLTAGLVGFVAFLYLAIRIGARPISPMALIRRNIQFMFSSSATNVAQFDTSLVGVAGGLQLAGVYGGVTRLLNPLNILISTALQIVIPEMTQAKGYTERLSIFRKIRTYTLFLSLALLSLSFVSPWVVSLLLGPNFKDSASIAVAICVAAALSAVSQIHLAWFYATHVRAAISGVMWSGVILGLASILTLTFILGLTGASIGLVLMQCAICVGLVHAWIQDTKEIRDDDA